MSNPHHRAKSQSLCSNGERTNPHASHRIERSAGACCPRGLVQGRRGEGFGVSLQLWPDYSTAFNMGGVAVVLWPVFDMILLETASIMSAARIVLSIAYFLTILTVVYFFLRAVGYSLMSLQVERRLGISRVAEDVCEKGVGKSTFLQRAMGEGSCPYGVFTKLHFIAVRLSWLALGSHSPSVAIPCFQRNC